MPTNDVPVHPPTSWQSISLVVANHQGKYNVLFQDDYITFILGNQYLCEVYFHSSLELIATAAVPVKSIAIGDTSGSMNNTLVLQSRSLVLSNSQDNISTSMNKLFEISVCLKFV